MKTLWIWILIAALSAIDCARSVDFVPPHGICALGKIGELRQRGPNQWTLDLMDITILIQDSALGVITTNEITVKTPAKVMLMTGLGGVLVTPQAEWVGRVALFSAIEEDGIYTVPNTPLPLSPNRNSFVVFNPDQTSAIQSIEEIARILNMTNSTTQQQRLEALVQSPTEPLFLRRFAVKEVARIVHSKFMFDPEIRAHFVKWRDSQQLIPELRISVDEVLVDSLPRDYQWSEERLDFLRKLRDSKDVSPEIRNKLTRRIDQAERLKTSPEEENRGQRK